MEAAEVVAVLLAAVLSLMVFNARKQNGGVRVVITALWMGFYILLILIRVLTLDIPGCGGKVQIIMYLMNLIHIYPITIQTSFGGTKIQAIQTLFILNKQNQISKLYTITIPKPLMV